MHKDDINDLDPTVPLSEQAAHWWIVLNTGPATAADHRAFGDWVSKSPERVQAFLQTARLTKALKSENLRWPDTPVEVLARQAREDADVVPLRAPSAAGLAKQPVRHVRQSAWLWGLAASVVVLLSEAWVFLERAQHYDTTVGELRSVVLADGSVVTLNAASSVEVSFRERRRLVRLTSGEALFQVARDATRPFDVIAGDTTIHAVGTAFNVDKRAAGTTVTVVEGRVAISSAGVLLPQDPHVSPSTADSSTPTFLDAGEAITVTATTRPLAAPKPANVATVTAWTQRKLVFEHRPLGEVAEEFNRYNRREIQITDPELRSQEVTGVFQANDPESFLDFMAKLPGVMIERDSASIKVSTSTSR